jgi:hypothetical protein
MAKQFIIFNYRSSGQNKQLNSLRLFPLIIVLFFSIYSSAQEEKIENEYPFWGEYNKTPISEIKNPEWISKDHIKDGWDWSLLENVTPSSKSKICIARNFVLTRDKVSKLSQINFKSNPVISHWVRWRELEPEEGKTDFSPLIENIKLASIKGYGSIVRIHFSAIDFAPDWIKRYNIPIRKETKQNPKKTNYEVSHPEFHKRYLKFIKALGESEIPQMQEVRGLFLGYASPSNGDEGIGPFHRNPEANDTVQHVRERIDAWAKAAKGVEDKVFMGGISNYGLSKGFGIRRGFVEMYLYHIPDDKIGQKLDESGYLYVDESNTMIKNNVFHGEENEEYEERWISSERNFRFGKTAVSFPYRYFTANLRLLQMRTNYLLNNEFSLLPEMFTWVSLSLGRTVEDSPDAWTFLRESYLRGNGGKAVKNFERWVYQRDAPGYETQPAVKIKQAIEMWMVEPGMYYDYVARKGNKIGFDVNEDFKSNHENFSVKISYFDIGTGSWSLVYSNSNDTKTKTIQNNNTGKLKTATFFIETDFKAKDLNFDLEIRGEENFEPTISFFRVIKD